MPSKAVYLVLMFTGAIWLHAAELRWNPTAPAPREPSQNLTLLTGPQLKSPPGEPWLDHRWKTVGYAAPEVRRSPVSSVSRPASERSTDTPPQTTPSHDVLKFDLKVPALDTTLRHDRRL